MKKLYLIGCVVAMLLETTALHAALTAEQMQFLSQRTIQGSARYVAMGGAMTAIGGDPSSVVDNPACVGLYRHFEISLTGEQYWSKYQSNTTLHTQRFAISQIGLMTTLTQEFQQKGVLFHNLMFAYNRLATFDRSLNVPNGNDLVNELDWGYMDQFSFLYGANISNQFYVGAGVNIPNLQYSHLSNNYVTDQDLAITGVGVSASLGAIYRPTQWFRVGASFVTPGYLHTRIIDNSYLRIEPNTLPLRVSGGIAFQILKYGMISSQYDYAYWNGFQNQHTLRTGLEGQVWRSVFVNAGYVNDFGMHTQYASGGCGYRSRALVAQIAYQYRWQNGNGYTSIWRQTDPTDIQGKGHRLVVTIGCKL